MRQRGFAWWVYLLAAGAAVALLWAVVAWIDGRGFERGKLKVKGEWDQANRDAETAARARRDAVAKALIIEEKRRLGAEQAAVDNHTKWQEALRESERNGKQLATCTRTPRSDAQVRGGAAGQPTVQAPGAGDVAGPRGADPDPGVRFTAEFLRHYDTAWTGSDGKPVFGAAARPPDAASAGAVGPRELLQVHGINAERCSAARRELEALMNDLRAAEAAWEAK